jgi:uncharacterized protein YjiS (DUF1127 family)
MNFLNALNLVNSFPLALAVRHLLVKVHRDEETNMRKIFLPNSPIVLSDAVEARSSQLCQAVVHSLRHAAATFRAALLDRQLNWWELNAHQLRDIGKTRAEAEREKILRSYGIRK